MARLPATLLALALASAGPALAQDAVPDFAAETLTGDWNGRRAALAARGVDVRLDYTADLLGNLGGGIRRGWTLQGLAALRLDLDLGRAAGWSGAQVRVSVLQTHGPSLTDRHVGSLATLSGIDAPPGARLFEAWLDQSLLDGRASLRVGQMAVDQEFYLSDRAGHFVNATFGWPAIFAQALPAGGNAYPVATPGLRLLLGRAEEGLSLRVGVFNGDPDPDGRNRSGTRFHFTGGAFAIAELGYAAGGPLPGAYRIGAWHHGGRFIALRSGEGLRGNHGFYLVADQALWRPEAEGPRGIGAFARLATVPAGRNTLDLALDLGVTWQGMLAARPDDVLGLAASFARVSGAARDARVPGIDPLLQRGETVVELSYAAQLHPGWVVQPTAQLVLNPGAEAGARTALVAGVRTRLAF